MLKIVIFLLLISTVHAQVLVQDHAIIKIDNTLFFKSDIKAVGEAIEQLVCINGKSLSLVGTGITDATGKKIVEKDRREGLEISIRRIIKLSVFLEDGSGELDKMLNRLNWRRCISSRRKDWNSWLIKLIKLEGYLQDRYGVDASAISKNELTRYIKENSNLRPEVAVQNLLKQKIKEIHLKVASFVDSVDGQIRHQIFQ